MSGLIDFSSSLAHLDLMRANSGISLVNSRSAESHGDALVEQSPPPLASARAGAGILNLALKVSRSRSALPLALSTHCPEASLSGGVSTAAAVLCMSCRLMRHHSLEPDGSEHDFFRNLLMYLVCSS